jgi:hypothetical protein
MLLEELLDVLVSLAEALATYANQAPRFSMIFRSTAKSSRSRETPSL